ncbi:hypothetical protein BKG77_07065 [Mycobacteroides chelonae]|nr:hypothetical protein BKG77_07065 [Mycobacteroides chelonae]
MPARIASPAVISLVEQYIGKELDDAKKFENSSPLDESGCWSLHQLASEIYMKAYEDGERAEAKRNRHEMRRWLDRLKGDEE